MPTIHDRDLRREPFCSLEFEPGFPKTLSHEGADIGVQLSAHAGGLAAWVQFPEGFCQYVIPSKKLAVAAPAHVRTIIKMVRVDPSLRTRARLFTKPRIPTLEN